jgi:hypothetical protein
MTNSQSRFFAYQLQLIPSDLASDCWQFDSHWYGIRNNALPILLLYDPLALKAGSNHLPTLQTCHPFLSYDRMTVRPDSSLMSKQPATRWPSHQRQTSSRDEVSWKTLNHSFITSESPSTSRPVSLYKVMRTSQNGRLKRTTLISLNSAVVIMSSRG